MDFDETMSTNRCLSDTAKPLHPSSAEVVGSTPTAARTLVPLQISGCPQNLAPKSSFLRLRHKKDKQTFALFVRVLLKYLNKKCPKEFQMARAVLRDSMERHRRREPGYESIQSVRTRLQCVVSPAHWERAQHYLHQLLLQQQRALAQKQQQRQTSSRRCWSVSSSSSLARRESLSRLQTIDETC